MAQQPGTNRQVQDNSILDAFNKQTYLGNAFIYSLGNTEITTTSEFPLLLLSNPAVSASGFPSNYYGLFCNLRKIICLTASQTAIMRFYLGPTVTSNGTMETPLNLRPASPSTSISNMYLNPSVSANGNLIFSLFSTPQTSDFSETLAIIDPGKSMLVTVQTSSATTFIATELAWYEI